MRRTRPPGESSRLRCRLTPLLLWSEAAPVTASREPDAEPQHDAAAIDGAPETPGESAGARELAALFGRSEDPLSPSEDKSAEEAKPAPPEHVTSSPRSSPSPRARSPRSTLPRPSPCPTASGSPLRSPSRPRRRPRPRPRQRLSWRRRPVRRACRRRRLRRPLKSGLNGRWSRGRRRQHPPP